MELRTFAKKVLFSTRLEDKLAPPESPITDASPGVGISAPAMPGRPDTLQFSREKGDTSFARARQLKSDDDRATLLHFFANHELLATELMALVLLKFPDAPAEFRRGILQTLREEQAHTQMYMRRMTACGLTFGDRPVNDFFWKSIANMQSPLDYVTRLSLTFEQANLDFAHHFAQLFRSSGDSSTAAILGKIYRDEISHVGYGLKWFRRWKGKDLTDWDAFRQQLQFPLSPIRAKGKAPFNTAGRLAAGLNEDFIRKLEVSTASRGRTPHVYVFNPGAEESASLQSANFTPSKQVAALTRDLDTVALFLAREDDLVLLHRQPSTGFLQRIKLAGLPVPEIEILDADGAVAHDSPNRNRKIGKLRPWGWSPDSVRLLEPLAEGVTQARTATRWIPEIAELYSKQWSVGQLQALIASEPALPLIDSADCGRCASAVGDVSAHAAEFLQRHDWVVLKAAFGMSGRGMLRIDIHALRDQRTTGWITNTLRRHKSIVVEPWLDRVFDLSMQYEVSRSADSDCQLFFKGGVNLINDHRGQFAGCKVSHQFVCGLPREVARFFNGQPQRRAWARELFEHSLPSLLAESLGSTDYEGPLGVDAFVYADKTTNRLKLQPVVEVNPRFTFGRLAVELSRNLYPGSRGTVEVVASEMMPAISHIETMQHGEQVRMRSGTLLLTEPRKDSRFGAVWRVQH